MASKWLWRIFVASHCLEEPWAPLTIQKYTPSSAIDAFGRCLFSYPPKSWRLSRVSPMANLSLRRSGHKKPLHARKLLATAYVSIQLTRRQSAPSIRTVRIQIVKLENVSTDWPAVPGHPGPGSLSGSLQACSIISVLVLTISFILCDAVGIAIQLNSQLEGPSWVPRDTKCV